MQKKRIIIRKLIWDDWNVPHIAQHDVHPDEVEAVCRGNPVVREGHRGRLFLIGKTKAERLLAVVLEPTADEGVYKPITAYDASKRNREAFENERRR